MRDLIRPGDPAVASAAKEMLTTAYGVVESFLERSDHGLAAAAAAAPQPQPTGPPPP